MGFPGTLKAFITYRWENDHQLYIEFKGIDEHLKPHQERVQRNPAPADIQKDISCALELHFF